MKRFEIDAVVSSGQSVAHPERVMKLNGFGSLAKLGVWLWCCLQEQAAYPLLYCLFCFLHFQISKSKM